MKRLLKYIGLLILSMILLGCSGQQNDIPTTESGQKLYHEVGDTFEFKGPESGLPFAIKVKDVWLEGFEEHEVYISEHIKNPDDSRALMFISYTVTNKGDETYEFKDDRFYPNNDVLPNLIHPANYILDVDITYPKTNLIEDMEDITDLALDPGKSMDITGAVLTQTGSAKEGAFVWDYDSGIPQVVFTRSQSKRRDQVGVYDLNEPIYIMDYDKILFNVTIHDIGHVKKDEDVEYIEREYEQSSFLVIDMTIENEGKQDITVPNALPNIDINVGTPFQREYFIKKGETEPITDTHINPGEEPTDGLIKAGETLEGTFYYEVEYGSLGGDPVPEARVFYPYRGFTDYPYYQQWVNYNLD